MWNHNCSRIPGYGCHSQKVQFIPAIKVSLSCVSVLPLFHWQEWPLSTIPDEGGACPMRPWWSYPLDPSPSLMASPLAPCPVGDGARCLAPHLHGLSAGPAPAAVPLVSCASAAGRGEHQFWVFLVEAPIWGPWASALSSGLQTGSGHSWRVYTSRVVLGPRIKRGLHRVYVFYSLRWNTLISLRN